MWSLLPRSAQLTAIIFAALFIAWGIQAVVEHFTNQHVWIVKWASLTVSVVGLVLTGIISLAWRRLWRL